MVYVLYLLVLEKATEKMLCHLLSSCPAIFFPDRIQNCLEETTINLKYPEDTYSMG